MHGHGVHAAWTEVLDLLLSTDPAHAKKIIQLQTTLDFLCFCSSSILKEVCAASFTCKRDAESNDLQDHHQLLSESLHEWIIPPIMQFLVTAGEFDRLNVAHLLKVVNPKHQNPRLPRIQRLKRLEMTDVHEQSIATVEPTQSKVADQLSEEGTDEDNKRSAQLRDRNDGLEPHIAMKSSSASTAAALPSDTSLGQAGPQGCSVPPILLCSWSANRQSQEGRDHRNVVGPRTEMQQEAVCNEELVADFETEGSTAFAAPALSLLGHRDHEWAIHAVLRGQPSR